MDWAWMRLGLPAEKGGEEADERGEPTGSGQTTRSLHAGDAVMLAG